MGVVDDYQACSERVVECDKNEQSRKENKPNPPFHTGLDGRQVKILPTSAKGWSRRQDDGRNPKDE
jgi:hypothetical protein